jgi:hypothetical protein
VRETQSFSGLLPKILSPTHFAKKLIGGGKKKAADPAAVVEEPAPAIDPNVNPQGQLLLVGGGLAVLAFVFLRGGRK